MIVRKKGENRKKKRRGLVKNRSKRKKGGERDEGGVTRDFKTAQNRSPNMERKKKGKVEN